MASAQGFPGRPALKNRRKRIGGKRNCEKIDKGLYKRYSKGENRYSLLYKFAVAPRVGAWVEIGNGDVQHCLTICRTPCGGVG